MARGGGGGLGGEAGRAGVGLGLFDDEVGGGLLFVGHRGSKKIPGGFVISGVRSAARAGAREIAVALPRMS